MSDSEYTPSQFDGIESRIFNNYSETNSENQQKIIEECMQFYLLKKNSLNETDSVHHLFCKSKVSACVITYLIIMIAGSGSEINIEAFDPISNSISNCTDCLINYHLQRSIIRKNLIIIKKVPYNGIQLTMKNLTIWESKNLNKLLSNAIDSNLNNSDLKSLLIKILIECLINPKILLLDDYLLANFNRCFKMLDICHSIITKNLKIYPGLIYLLFQNNDLNQRNWALSKFPYNNLSSNNSNNNDLLDYYDINDLNPLFIEEYEIHFFNIQNPNFFTNEKSIQFWTNLMPLIRFSSIDAINNSLIEPYSCSSYRDDYKIRIVPLISIFINHIFSYLDSPLPFLLRFLALLLQKFKLKLFDLIKPHNYMSFFDMSFNNPSYKKFLNILKPSNLPDNLLDLDTLRTPFFVDLIKWLEICSNLLKNSNSCQFSIAMFAFMADFIKNENCGNFIGSYVMENMNNQLILKNSIYTKNLEIELNYKASARNLINKKAILLYDALLLNPTLKLKALQLIKTCLIFDIENFSYHSIKLNGNELSTTPDFNNDLWNLIINKLSTNGNLLIEPIFSSFENILKIFQIDIAYKKSKLLENSNSENLKELFINFNKHNKIILDFTNSIENILNKFSEYLTQQQVKIVLMDLKTSKGFWSCIFSPIDKIYESSIAFLYEAFNVDDRLEAFKECLNLNLSITLSSFKLSLVNFTNLKLFIPTKRIVKILIDFITCLFDPMNNLVNSISNSINWKSLIIEFWIDIWGFLGMIFKNIFDWSMTYENLKLSLSKEIADKITNDLLNFTRDVLDLSHLVMNGFNTIMNSINSDNSINDSKLISIKKTMLNPIISTLQDLFKWLRLSDSALLIRCVDLITKILDLSFNLNINLNDDLLTILIKLCLRAKKFNNKMNIEQTGELLLRARKINDKLVELISIQVEDEKKKKSQSPPIQILNSNNQYQYQSRKQFNLNNFLKPSIREPIPSFDAPKRLSKLEMAQLKLNEKRKTIEPAPARPSGFNKKKIINITESESENDNSDNSDNESNHNNNGLFTKEQVVEKLKKSKAALQSLQMPRFGSNNINNNGSNNNKLKDANSELNKRKKAEELMRLRLNVDMTPLYKTILSWSYNNDKELPSDYDSSKYNTVKDKFESVLDYQKCFEPLLLLECWQSIQRAKQIEQETPFRMTIGSRSATDSFFDIYASVKKSIVNELHYFNDNDLLVLMLIDNLPTEDVGIGIPKKLIKNCKLNCFAKVREIKNTVGSYADITLRVSSDNEMVHKISASMEIVGLKVNTMTTLEREYSSLKGLQYYDLCNEIINATPSKIEQIDNNKISQIKNIYDVNDSQARAISGTVEGNGFSLIQGPPGTGKTKTILGVIGYFLTQIDKNIHRVVVPGSRINLNNNDNNEKKKKILICAPSNAAVDELVLRIRKGIKNSKGEVFKPNVVRLGKSDAINEQVKDLTLEEQVDKQLSKLKNNDDSTIREEHRKCIIERDELRKKLESNKLNESEISKTEIRLQEVMTKRRELGKRLDEMREQRAVNYRNREIERRNLQYKILNNAQVVCSTLSGSAHDVLASMSMTFETVVIDEAAQCIELSAIIPLRYGCKKCIMVGDPNQLPPTVLSQKAASFKYEQSLFVRMQNNFKDSIYLLDVQYRMHPEISKFPSFEFYDSKLKDGPDMDKINKRPWHIIKDYGPYRFFNIRGQQNKNEKTKSLFNIIECKIILEIVEDLYRRFPDIDWSNKIGIISPYKEQVRLLKKTFIDKYGFLITKQIDFNTVDGFQGQEKDIILFSCVRAETHTGVGFLADIRRMNVALTRARASLWVVGSVDALVSNKTWKDLYEDAKNRNLVSQAYLGFTSKLIQSGNKVENNKDKNEVIPKSSGVILPKGDNFEIDNKKKFKKNKRPYDHINNNNINSDKTYSKIRKVSDNSMKMPKKKFSGEIINDNKVIRNKKSEINTKNKEISVKRSSGVIPPKGGNVPEGLIKISKKKTFQIPKGINNKNMKK